MKNELISHLLLKLSRIIPGKKPPKFLSACLSRSPWFIPMFLLCLGFALFIPSVFSSSPASRMTLALRLESLLREAAPPELLKEISVEATFPDLNLQEHQDISAVLHRHLLKGFSTGEFRPQAPIHGDELLRTLAQTLRHLGKKPSEEPCATGSFVTPLWAPRESVILARQNIIPTESPLWQNPGLTISEEELDAIFQRMQETLKKVPENPPPSSITQTPPPNASPDSVAASLVVSGVVLDAITRSPIPKAQLLIGKESLTTGPDGRFSLPDRPRDQIVDLLVTAEGYRSLSIKHRVGFRKELDLLLKPRRATLKVTLTSSVSGERVQAATARIGDKTVIGSEVGTLDFGALKPGYHRLNIQAPGFLPQEFLVCVEGSSIQREFKLQPSL